MNKTLISILSGLGGMFGWGTSDFFANVSTGNVGHEKTFFWSQVVGLLIITGLCSALLYNTQIHFPLYFLFLTILSGITYALGYLLFYKGFEIGNISVVSAVVNTQTLFIIFISYFLKGERLTTFQIPAIILIILGVLLVSVNFDDFKKGTVSLVIGVKETLLAAVMFGIFYWPLNESIVKEVHWLPVQFVTKLTALITVAIIAFFTKEKLSLGKQSKKTYLGIAAIGALEALGVLSVSFGHSIGDAILISPISSALTLVTVALAMIFLKEKIAKAQALGIALTVLGIMMAAF